MAKIEAYETALFDALQLLGHARYVSDVERARDVIEAGATSVAVISDLLSTGNPEARVREYLRALS